MPSTTEISVSQLSRIIGQASTPAVIDVRLDEDLASDRRLIPGARHRDHRAVESWAEEVRGRGAVIVCRKGEATSQGTAAWLRHKGIAAEVLEGGFEAWRSSGGLLFDPKSLPERNAHGQTVWVTRTRPKVDRIACPWLIRRFIDPDAVFLFVDAGEVLSVAARFGATPFDVEDVFFSHRDERCTFDTMIEEFGLRSPALDRLALMVRGADTARLDLSPQAPGLLAASLGLSRMFKDDLEQLEAGILLYDAFYRWSRDAVEETHNWPAKPKAV